MLNKLLVNKYTIKFTRYIDRKNLIDSPLLMPWRLLTKLVVLTDDDATFFIKCHGQL